MYITYPAADSGAAEHTHPNGVVAVPRSPNQSGWRAYGTARTSAAATQCQNHYTINAEHAGPNPFSRSSCGD